MKTRKLKTFLSAGVSALVVAAVASAAFAQDASATSNDTTKADGDKKGADSQVVIVTSRRKALKTAIDIKKNSDTIVDSIVADEAGALPDTSVTEVLQRVSGVTVSRFNTNGASGGSSDFRIEGSGVTVRGLPYNSGTLNGRQAFSANGASALSWGDVTPELMGGVDVYKASRADQLEGGTSSVDLRTRMPFDYKKPEFDLSLGASYGDQARKVSPDISALYTRRFDTKVGEVGVLVDGAFSRYYAADSDAQMGPFRMENDPNRASGMALVPTGYNWSQGGFTRDRSGLYSAVQWKPSDDLVLNSTFFYSKYKTDSQYYSGSWGLNATSSLENIPTNATFDKYGAMTKGSLYGGGTGLGNLSFGNNTWLYQAWSPDNPNWGWLGGALGANNLPSLLTADCRQPYGSTSASTPTVNWGDWADAPGQQGPNDKGMFYCQTSPGGVGLNLSGSSSFSSGSSSTMDLSQSFVWTPNDKLRVRGAIQYVLSIGKSRSMYAAINQADPNLTSASFDLTKARPMLGGFNATALANTNTAYFAQFAYNGQDNKGTMGAYNIDVDYKFDGDHFIKSVSFGARSADRRERDNFIGSYWAPIAESWNNYYPHLTGDTNPVVKPSDYELYSFKHFFGGKDSPGSVLLPNPTMMTTFDWRRPASMSYDVVKGGMTLDQFYKQYFASQPGETDSFNENRAFYVETKFGANGFGFIPAFSGNFGVRFVDEILRSKGFFNVPVSKAFYLDQASALQAINLQLTPNPGATAPEQYQTIAASSLRTRKYSYTRALPSLNVKFDISSKLILRLAASEAMAPPNFNDVKAGGSITPAVTTLKVQTFDAKTLQPGPVLTADYLNTMSSTSGASLKPTMLDSADASLEWYPKDGVYAYLDLFVKRIRDEDLFTNFYQTNPTSLLNVSTQTPATINTNWFYRQNSTATVPADIRGLELGGRKFFDELPDPFKGFGLSGSVTYVDSTNPAVFANSVVGPYVPPNQTQDPNMAPHAGTDFTKMPYYGMSKWSYNIEAYYSKGPWNARVAYNWHSRQLMSTNVNPLSFNTSGGNAYVCTACITSTNSQGLIWNAVPLWSDAAGYLDLSLDYKINQQISMGVQANNVLNTLSKTSQEPLPGVFERYDTYMSDRRINAYLRMHF